MAVDIEEILANIRSFYDFADRAVIHVGAGGGQLVDYATSARSVLAVDSDADAVRRLTDVVRGQAREDLFTVVCTDFLSVSAAADVVLFEFCLHEMEDPEKALCHASTLAPDMVVLDHSPESRWGWYMCEDDKATRSWAAVRRLPVVREVSYRPIQRFRDYAELHTKIEPLGAPALARISEFTGRTEIGIEMEYRLALVQAPGSGT